MDLEALKRSFLKKFQEDTADRLQKIQHGVLGLEKPAPEGTGAAEGVARELHTMKGEARILGLSAIGQLAHASEEVLRASQEGRLASRIATDLLLRACDAVTELMADHESAKGGNANALQLCQRLAEAAGQPTASAAPVASAAVAPSVPSAAPATPATPVTSGAALPTKPALPPPPQAAQGLQAKPAARPLDRTIRVNVDLLDGMGVRAGDLLVESARARLRFKELDAILARYSRLAERLLRTAEATATREDVALHRQLEIYESDLHLLRDDTFRYVRQHLDGLNALSGDLTQLADDVATARLVPLSTVFDALPRAARELAHAEGKEVAVEIDNPNVGVDRGMLQDLRDALVHLIRNAVAHGIEPASEREALGKPRAGSVRVRVRAAGDLLHLELTDDGRGIDPERLKRVAVLRGHLTQEQAALIGDRDALELVFRAGFTTREEVNDLSGRGVGMDVVKRKVEALGGSVSLQSKPGKGTTVALRLPQSLSLMRVLLFRLGTDVYGMPAAEVESVARIQPQDRTEIMGSVAVQHRGRPIALTALGPLLGLNGGPSHDRPTAVIVRHGQDSAALVVDGFVDEREVAVKPCGGELLEGAPFIAGTASLEDGRIAVLLHLPDVMAEVKRFARPTAKAPAAKRLRVLLVDDSPIARATAGAVVKALGHTVVEAHDGEEGLQCVLDHETPFDLVLTDVQMPKMDGFALTRRLKSMPAHARLPVIILSSLASPEDKRRGVDAGADAYLVKGELGVESLAQTIDRLV